MTGHRITGIVSDSVADELGIGPGDFLLSVNGKKIVDVFDYGYLTRDSYVELEIKKPDGTVVFEIEKDEDEDVGLEFDSYLMDNVRRCANGCVFCFVDRLPCGMRESLYFKDDDPRLSFLRGNYVTLTNAGPEEIKRLVSHRLSPINISVHATDPDLRSAMLKNPRAGLIMDQLNAFADAGISMNFQAVICKSVNDGAALDKTIEDLSRFHPYGMSLSVVPAGTTKYGAGLNDVAQLTPDDARELITQVDSWQRALCPRLRTRFVYAADELYARAGLPFPARGRYEDFPQLENGVGMAALFFGELKAALSKIKPRETAKTFDIVTGAAAYELMSRAAEIIKKKFPRLNLIIHRVENDFFGECVTVSGLLTGRDIIRSLKGKLSGNTLLIPGNALRAGADVFLDDVRVPDLSERLGARTVPCEISGRKFLRLLTE